MSNLPTSFCIDIVAEKEHKRLQEFKDWIIKKAGLFNFNYRYYGFKEVHKGYQIPFGELLTLDRFFELLDPKIYTILDLANGVCAVVNDGTELDIERVLQSAFPKDDWSVSHSDIYFTAYKPLDGEWEGSSVTDLPTQSVKLFLQQLEKPEPITSINVGDEFMCVEDMAGSYIKGSAYRSEIEGCITDTNGNKDHWWILGNSKNFTKLNRHFIRHQPTKEEVKEVTSETDNSNGLRYNNGKLRWSLVDFQSLEDLVKVLEFGASKYADHNWKKGLKTTEIFESMMRHMTAYISGEDNDQESGLSHIGHMMCNAMFLAYMQREKPEFDTRILKQIQNNK